MKTARPNAAKDSYKRLRCFSWEQLWEEHVPAFNAATSPSEARNAGLVRAVGVVFSESGRSSQKEEVAAWLRSLLQDQDEKIRRYAMAALPKIGAEAADEEALINLLRKANPPEREKKFLARALDKIGGKATLEIADQLSGQTALKVKASVAREERPSEILLDQAVEIFSGLRIHLRGRRGLEGFVRKELESTMPARGLFEFRSSQLGLVEIASRGPFRLSDLLTLRCFGTLAFVLGTIPKLDSTEMAALITAPSARALLQGLTKGSIRYRLDFPSLGHQRGLVRDIANRAYALCPDLLNDARSAPWAVEIHPHRGRFAVELRPRFSPDPRFAYRRLDVPAASHPPLAACMARLAGSTGDDVVWDPFCGSGLELIERGFLGGVSKLLGSDRSAEAIDVAKCNLAASGLRVTSDFFHGDFRNANLAPGSISQIISNPPMGRRVPIADLQGLIRDLFNIAARVLQPGGVLVFANPLSSRPSDARLKLDSTQRIDLGGFDVHLEKFIKTKR
jgi:23S rRNA G2445 N2-methylase RlmL